MMNQGSSEISMMFGISTKDAEAAVKRVMNIVTNVKKLKST